MTWLARDDHGLFKAVQSQNETKVRQALKYGAGIDIKNAYGLTALHEAAECGHDKMVQLLLRYGAKIDKKRWEKKYGAACGSRVRTRNSGAVVAEIWSEHQREGYQ